MSWLAQRIESFGHAIRGVRTLLLEEHHAQLHLLATLIALTAGGLLGISRADWQVLILTIAMVWLAEGLNTALEHLCDAAVPEHHSLIGKAKDVAAGSVLITAGFAVVMGALIFLPYIF
ncbi:diacylglycerol kinase family protein [Halioglobus maricola]|uniref:Diacylglycerol kinase family protein n=1 Tax=Halioglobus maricola TaxID=2601894 RepID=A0A5P9NH97_9GAMM|nr:diacylglycerol kinase family protein [Halioglobus maricola]QFU74905.1 diacylglycerol kinase family protein [Halioglobus maricola]